MASIINALSSGTGGIVTAGDASGILQLQTANTTALTVNTNGSLTVSSTGSGITYASSGGSGLRMYGAGGTNQWDVYGNGANIRFSDNTGGGIVVVDTAARFGSTIGVGATTPSSSGAGITFPATQSASSDANTLDDYEEGTWTPTITDGYTRTYSSSNTTGRYVKVGKMVYIWGVLQGSTRSGTANAYGWINLPFPANNLTQASPYTAICEPYGITHTNSVITAAPQWDAPSTAIIKNTTISGNVSYLDPTNIPANFELGFFLVIWTNS
jgi:hypothetical protein